MTNLLDLCYQGQKASKYTPVKLPLIGKASIYGFIAYHLDLFGEDITCPPLGPVSIIGNRVIFSMNDKFYRFPVFDSVKQNSDEKLPVHLLYVPRLLLLPSYHSSAYVNAMKSGNAGYYISKISNIKLIENAPFYYPEADEFSFESSSSLKGISNAFIVITSRISTQDGSIIYEAYNPRDVEVLG